MTGQYPARVAVVSTTAAWCCDGNETAWLTHASRWAGQGARFFLAAEVGQGQDHRLAEAILAVRRVRGGIWEFSLDDGMDRVTARTRLDHIVAGRNLATAAAMRWRPDWILYLDSDVTPPVDAISKLLEVDWPVAGGNVPNYCMDVSRTLPGYPFPVVERMNTAGFLLVRADVAAAVPWRHEAHNGLTDDPCFHADVTRLGHPTRVRCDVIGQHPVLQPVHNRGADLNIDRTRRYSMTPTVIVMPVRGRLDLTETILGQLAGQKDAWDRVLVYDNEQEGMSAGAVLTASSQEIPEGGGEVSFDFDDAVDSDGEPFDVDDDTADDSLDAVYPAESLADVVEGIIAVNDLPPDSIMVIPAPERSIYEMWNDGWQHALDEFRQGPAAGVNVLFLNNDVEVPDDFVETLSQALRAPGTEDVWAVYPDETADLGELPYDGWEVTLARTRGTKRHGGLLGHAFMVKGEAVPLGGLPMFDTGYTWWCGDDELVAEIESRGYTAAKVVGLPVKHLNEATAQAHPFTHDAKATDMARFNERWPGYPG